MKVISEGSGSIQRGRKEGGDNYRVRLCMRGSGGE